VRDCSVGSGSIDKTTGTVLLAVAASLTLCCGGGVAVVAVKKVVERANDTPSGVDVGARFTHDGFVADDGWQVVEERGDFGIDDLVLTNNAIGTRPAYLDFTVYRDDELIATISCSAGPIGHHDSGAVDCFSADAYVDDFDTIKVADPF
jgi:hypothetical protein